MIAPRLRLALFDCDGTLVDSQHRIFASMAAAFAERGHTAPDPAGVRSVVGLSLVEAVGRLLPDMVLAEQEATAESYKKAFFGFRQRGEHEEPLYPGVIEALDRLNDAGFILGVATGKSRRGLDAVLDMHGLAGRFVTLQTADRSPGKPNPAMVLQAMAEVGVDPADTVMIGDTVFDIHMGRNAGVASIGVGWGYHEIAELEQAGAVSVARDFSELADLVLAR